jgi:hypothetical protein
MRPNDIIALADGAAVVYETDDEYQSVGQVARFRKGVMTVIEASV